MNAPILSLEAVAQKWRNNREQLTAMEVSRLLTNGTNVLSATEYAALQRSQRQVPRQPRFRAQRPW